MKTLSWPRRIAVITGILIVLALLIQVIPGKRTNPAVALEPAWTSAEAKQIAEKACFDCHSNETTWPWYSKIAPMSWLVVHDVNEGREYLNFSEWGNGYETDELVEVIQEDEMPPRQYTLLHSEAKLTDREKDILMKEFQSFEGGESEDEDNDD